MHAGMHLVVFAIALGLNRLKIKYQPALVEKIEGLLPPSGPATDELLPQ